MFTLKLNVRQTGFWFFINFSLPPHNPTSLTVFDIPANGTSISPAAKTETLESPLVLLSLFTTYAWSKGKLGELYFESICRLLPFPSLSTAPLLAKLFHLFLFFGLGCFVYSQNIVVSQKYSMNILARARHSSQEALTASNVTQRGKVVVKVSKGLCVVRHPFPLKRCFLLMSLSLS